MAIHVFQFYPSSNSSFAYRDPEIDGLPIGYPPLCGSLLPGRQPDRCHRSL